MEKFIECQFDSNYLIGDNGTVRSLLARTIARYKDGVISGGVKPDGYKIYFIGGKWYYAHRLVAQHFCDNPCNHNEVNHIDGVKLNNNYTNLEWCTHLHNIRHLYDTLGYRRPKSTKKRKPALQSTRSLMSVAKRGEKHPRFKGYYLFEGVKYTSMASLPRGWKISTKTAKYYCMNDLFGYSFEPIGV